MTQYPALCHFKKGISSVSQWTGTENKEMQSVFVSLLASAVEDSVLMVACSLLDFIYYAQLQQHMDTTLIAMEESTKSFHEHKHILIELELHEDFNIPKIHSMQHYISLIHALGSADGYNTKYPEQLHINYAKDSYHTSNKCNYVEQMALWLQCQEAMHYKSAYLAWRKSDVVPLEDGYMDVQVHYKVAKTPPHCQVSIDHIECDYGAVKFIPMLKCFLASHLGGYQMIQPFRLDRFDMYNYLYVETGPSIITGHSQSFQEIRASPNFTACGHKNETPARFDTVFILGEDHPHMEIITLNSVQPAQVHVIFKLPEHLRSYPHQLAYVEWFTALHCWDPMTSLYIVQCRKEISKDWALANVLEKAVSFYVNSYIDLDMFLALE
ncbi:hypothetical protein EDD16DRAFT_1547518 [Pisolithus croceorrhizus]|nr:hypothetical protein EDD16DRAFT_1547518 [Pisolithus croceorrhizus]